MGGYQGSTLWLQVGWRRRTVFLLAPQFFHLFVGNEVVHQQTNPGED